jgi:hypothetical protein
LTGHRLQSLEQQAEHGTRAEASTHRAETGGVVPSTAESCAASTDEFDQTYRGDPTNDETQHCQFSFERDCVTLEKNDAVGERVDVAAVRENT